MKLGKLIKKTSKTLTHRFTVESYVESVYESETRINRDFYDRKSRVHVGMLSSSDNVLYLNTDCMRNEKKFKAALNEAKRLSHTDKVSEFFVPIGCPI